MATCDGTAPSKKWARLWGRRYGEWAAVKEMSRRRERRRRRRSTVDTAPKLRDGG